MEEVNLQIKTDKIDKMEKPHKVQSKHKKES